MGLLDTFRTSISQKKSVVSNDQRIVNRHYQLLDQINVAYREKNYERAEKYCLEECGYFQNSLKHIQKFTQTIMFYRGFLRLKFSLKFMISKGNIMN